LNLLVSSAMTNHPAPLPAGPPAIVRDQTHLNPTSSEAKFE
jgi:hypothetical protein